MAYTPLKSTWDRTKDRIVPYWLSPTGILQEVEREAKPTAEYHPLTWADNPIPKDRLKELWEECEGKPLRFARAVELEHGIRNWEVESG